jgi:hypothetical protein
MKSFIITTGLLAAASMALVLVTVAQVPAPTQPLARRLILKDGTYQSVTKYEIQGDRVRYFSAERGEWEEVPKSLIDWEATNKFEEGREQSKASPEAAALDKQIESERKTEQARSPEVAPGLRLPDEAGVYLLETFQNQPQLSELQQSGSDLNQNTKTNILRAAINPMGGVKQTIELPEGHAKTQSHSAIPSIYVNLDDSQGAPATAQTNVDGDLAPLPLIERYKIIRLDSKNGKRIAGTLKIALTGKMKTDQRFVPTTATAITGGWVKLTPTEDLPTGEYAVAELLEKEGINLYVWDFGVNSSAPANPSALKPEPADAPKADQTSEIKKR